MSDKTGIEWTRSDDGTPGATWNPVTGCEDVSPGCLNCYARTFAERWRGAPGHHFENGFDVTLRPERLDQPLRWKRPRRIFVNSMSDLFHKDVPDEYIARVFAVMAMASQHTFLILTKRHGRMRSFLQDDCRCGSGHLPGIHLRSAMDWAGTPHSPTYVPGVVGHEVYHNRPWPLPNVWLGVSAEDQHWADIRIPALLDTPAAVRFVSAEPLLGPVDLSAWIGDASGSSPESRGRGVPRSGDGRTDDRCPGARLESDSAPRRPLGGRLAGDPMRTPTGGESGREVLSGPSHVQRPAGSRIGSPPRVETFQRPDTGQPDGESQEWPLHGEPARESGIGDVRRAAAACQEGSPAWTSGSVGRSQLNGETDHGPGTGDLFAPGRRGATALDSDGLRRGVSDDLADRAGRPPISWVICGGESGPKARPMHPEWARSLRDQCARAGIPYLFKQWGEWGPRGGENWPLGDAWRAPKRHCWVNPADGRVKPFGAFTGTDDMEWARMFRVGKKAAGRILDGREWSEFPRAAEAVTS